MTHDLLILRHGHAQHSSEKGDFGRELKDKGKRNAQRMGVWLARNQLIPDLTVASPAVRAKRTAEKACKTAGLRGGSIQFEKNIYNASTAALIDIVRALPEDTGRVLLVGHNPGFESLAMTLAKESNYFGMTPGTLVHFRLEGPWRDTKKKCAELVEIVRPEELPEGFPFPKLDGSELRSRPAYYYKQSSVVPFRRNEGALEVLIISSSKRKHWVVPKGIHDPGLTAQESAAKEAFEEAGIEGRVLKGPIGSYSYPKWDATCDVAVYPMEVERVLPEEKWEESHRGRRWVSVEEAAATVKNPDVGRMVAKLPAHLEEIAE